MRRGAVFKALPNATAVLPPCCPLPPASATHNRNQAPRTGQRVPGIGLVLSTLSLLIGAPAHAQMQTGESCAIAIAHALADATAVTESVRADLALAEADLEANRKIAARLAADVKGLRAHTGYDGPGAGDTRIETDQRGETVSIFIDGREILRVDKDGVLVDGNFRTFVPLNDQPGGPP